MTDLDKHITAVARTLAKFHWSVEEPDFEIFFGKRKDGFEEQARAVILEDLRHVLEREQMIGDSFSVRRMEELIAEIAND